MELFQNKHKKQDVAEKVRSRPRVICATPIAKGAQSGASELFLCCVCSAAVTIKGLTCNPDFNLAIIGGNTVWTPVKNLAFTLDVNATWLDQKYSG
jgi:hypothetical protein